MREGVLIVEPYSSDACSNYKGFGGDFRPGFAATDEYSERGLAPVHDLEKAVSALEAIIADGAKARLLLVSHCEPNRAQFTFAGFDVGVLETGYAHFSAVLNDIWNPHGAFQRMRATLNEHGLFADEWQAMAFARLHDAHLGDDVESFPAGQKMAAIPIWLYERGPSED
jgi:hypothetical protein